MLQQFIAKRSDQEKKVLYIAALFVLLALVDRLFLGPVLERLRTIDDDINQQKTSVVRDLRFLSYKNTILKESEVFNKYFTEKIPDDDVVNAHFLGSVEKLARRSNVNLIKSTPSQSKKKKDYMEYYANLECTGKLGEVVAFMHSINSSEDLMKIVKFNIIPKKGAVDEISSSMVIKKMIVSPNSAPTL